MNERITRLEEKIAYLERHVTAQDKAMLEIGDHVAALQREIKALRQRAQPGGAEEQDADDGADQRPPHY